MKGINCTAMGCLHNKNGSCSCSSINIYEVEGDISICGNRTNVKSSEYPIE